MLFNKYVLLAAAHSIILAYWIRSIDCLTCVQSGAKSSFSLNPFNEIEFQLKINESRMVDNVPKGQCHVQLTIDYTNSLFDVEFPKRSSTGSNYNEIQMTFLSIHRPLESQSVQMSVTYTCYSGIDCNRNYVLKYFSSMIAMNYSEIQEKLSSIFTSEQEGKVHCSLDAQSSNKCSVPLCVADEIDNGRFKATCGSGKSDETKFELTVRDKKDGIKESIKYVCNFNNCNDEGTFQNAKSAVELYHEGLFKFLDLPEIVTRHSTLKSFTKHTISTPNKNNNSAIAETGTSISLVIFILFLSAFIS